jgi:hypothetical protein
MCLKPLTRSCSVFFFFFFFLFQFFEVGGLMVIHKREEGL